MYVVRVDKGGSLDPAEVLLTAAFPSGLCPFTYPSGLCPFAYPSCIFWTRAARLSPFLVSFAAVLRAFLDRGVASQVVAGCPSYETQYPGIASLHDGKMAFSHLQLFLI